MTLKRRGSDLNTNGIVLNESWKSLKACLFIGFLLIIWVLVNFTQNRQKLTDEDLKAICLSACQISELTGLHLNLNENLITNVGLVYLGKFLSVIQLESLEIFLSGNSFDDKGAIYLLSQIGSQSRLENVQVSFSKYSVHPQHSHSSDFFSL